MRRLREVLLQLALAVDRGAQTVIVGAAYLLRLTRYPPRSEETISSYVGRGQLRGAWWARLLAPAIDRLFMWLGEPPGHCRRNIMTIDRRAAPQP